jgi:hypothetical protein
MFRGHSECHDEVNCNTADLTGYGPSTTFQVPTSKLHRLSSVVILPQGCIVSRCFSLHFNPTSKFYRFNFQRHSFSYTRYRRIDWCCVNIIHMSDIANTIQSIELAQCNPIPRYCAIVGICTVFGFNVNSIPGH